MSLPRLGHDPREGRDAKASQSIEWVPALVCWCVFDTGAVTAILKSSDFEAPDFDGWHQMLGRMGIDCAPAIEALHHIASANEGERHAEVRRETARVIVARSGPAKEAARRKTAELFSSLCRPGAQVDLVREIIEPVCDTTFEGLLGALCPATPEDSVSGSQIFDLYLSLNRRKQIVARSSEMLEAFTAAGDKLRTSPSYATAIKMLGYDSLVGSLGHSILHLLKQAPERRFCEIDYPQNFPETGVPYVERFAVRDCAFGGASIKQGATASGFIWIRAVRTPTAREPAISAADGIPAWARSSLAACGAYSPRRWPNSTFATRSRAKRVASRIGSSPIIPVS
jgi:hypothetical protein